MIKNNPGLECFFNNIGISNNIRERTKIMALRLGVTSIQLGGKNYNPQARIFNKTPSKNILEAHNLLYKQYREAL